MWWFEVRLPSPGSTYFNHYMGSRSSLGPFCGLSQANLFEINIYLLFSPGCFWHKPNWFYDRLRKCKGSNARLPLKGNFCKMGLSLLIYPWCLSPPRPRAHDAPYHMESRRVMRTPSGRCVDPFTKPSCSPADGCEKELLFLTLTCKFARFARIEILCLYATSRKVMSWIYCR